MIPDGSNREVDLASAGFPNPVPDSVDAWLARADCDKLFDGAYPGSAPLCRTVIGPVALGQVSDRVKVDPGLYRVFIQAYSGNANDIEYVVDVGVWGTDCKTPAPTTPSQ